MRSMKRPKKAKIEMLKNSLSKDLGKIGENSFQSDTGEVLDLLEGGFGKEMNDDTKQVIRDIRSIQSHNEALLEKADRFLKEIENKDSS